MTKHPKHPAPVIPSKRAPDDGAPLPVDSSGKPDAGALTKRWGGRVPRDVQDSFDEALAYWNRKQ